MADRERSFLMFGRSLVGSGEKYVESGTQSGLGNKEPLKPLLSFGLIANGYGEDQRKMHRL